MGETVIEQARERWQIIGWLDAGYDYANIAARLGKRPDAVGARARWHGAGVRANPRLYSIRRITHELFQGIYAWHVRDWVRRGWLRAYRVRGRYARYRTTHDAIVAFLEKEQTWLAWQPWQLRDADLRHWTEEMRAAATWRWLGAKEVARLTGHTRQHVYRLCRLGHYPTATKYMRCWYIRSDDSALREKGNRGRETNARIARDLGALAEFE